MKKIVGIVAGVIVVLIVYNIIKLVLSYVLLRGVLPTGENVPLWASLTIIIVVREGIPLACSIPLGIKTYRALQRER